MQVSVERNHFIQIQEQFPHQINESYYFYDALGRRVQSDYWKNDERSVGQGNTGSWVQQGSEITYYNGLSFDHLAQLSYRGNIQYTNYPDGTRVTVHEHYTRMSLDHVYTHANGSLLLSSETQGNSQHINFQNRHYLHQDQLGSTVMTTNQWGREEQAIAYDAFGHVIDPPHRMISYTYNGKVLDPMTGLYDYGFRDYNAQQGRFQTIDPIRDGRNWFAYVGNDPVNFIDLLGLEAEDVGPSDTQDETVAPDPLSDGSVSEIIAIGSREFETYIVVSRDGGKVDAGVDILPGSGKAQIDIVVEIEVVSPDGEPLEPIIAGLAETEWTVEGEESGGAGRGIRIPDETIPVRVELTYELTFSDAGFRGQLSYPEQNTDQEVVGED